MTNFFARNKKDAKPTRRQNEFAVIGLGRFGSALARRLVLAGHTVLGIDTDARQVQAISDDIDDALILDATNEDALNEIDIAAFETVVVTIVDDFEASTLICSSLKRLGVRNVIGVSHSDRHRDILLRVGADRVVQPLQEMGSRLADDLAATGVIQSMPIMTNQEVAEMLVPATLAGKTISHCMRKKLVVLAIIHGEGIITSPSLDTVLQEGDMLIIMGEPSRIEELGRSS